MKPPPAYSEFGPSGFKLQELGIVGPSIELQDVAINTGVCTEISHLSLRNASIYTEEQQERPSALKEVLKVEV